MFLYNMTSEEVARLDRQMVVVAPFGAVEQHSWHLPLGTDSIIGEAITRRLEKQMPEQVLILPMTWLGCSRHHMDFPGSMTAEIETFVATGEQIVDSLAEHGFRKYLLLNSHGGNIAKLSIMTEKLRYRLGSDFKVVGVTYWHLIGGEIREIRETPLGGMGHACELETSLLLATCPELVRRERMEADGPARLSPFESKDMFDAAQVSVTKTFKELSRHGGIGDPMTASSEKGERIFTEIVKNLGKLVETIRVGSI